MTGGRIALAGSLALGAGLALVPAVATAGSPAGQASPGIFAQGLPGRAPRQQPVVSRGRGGQGGAAVRVVVPPTQQSLAPQPVVTLPTTRPVVTSSATASAFVFASSYAPGLAYGPAVSYDVVAYDPSVAYAQRVAYAAAAAYPSATAVTYTAPYIYEPSLVIYNPNVSEVVASAPSATAAALVAPAPMPGVVEYSTGRYELRGDGMATPYVWVWIPNPPPGPPTSGPPTSDPPAAVASPAPERDDPPGPRLHQLYRWTDAAGATHWTDRLEKVPQQHRAAAGTK